MIKAKKIQITYWLGLYLALCSVSVFAQDTDAPDVPVIDSLSVIWESPSNPEGDVLIRWQFCDSTDIRSYYILYLDAFLGTYQLLDSVDAHTNWYLDTKPYTNPTSPQTYVVQAVDSSNNTSAHSEFHTTSVLSVSQTQEDCRVQADLHWQNYIGWEEGIQKILLYRWKAGKSFLIGTFESSDSVCVYTLPDEHQEYEFFIRTISQNGKSSSSNKVVFDPQLEGKPSFIRPLSSRIKNKTVFLHFALDNTASIKNYELARSTTPEGFYKALRDFPNYTEDKLKLSDVLPQLNGYFYKLFLKDDCGRRIDSSVFIPIIWLQGFPDNQNASHILDWTAVENGESDSKWYQLYSYQEDLGQEAQLLKSDISSLTYTHDLKALSSQIVSKVCYYIDYSDASFDYTCRSNTVCLAQQPRLFMPNAFNPKDRIKKNRFFKPIASFIKQEDYYFAVYDQWGMIIFETEDVNEAWDGKIKNTKELYPPGFYIFLVKYSSVD